MNGENDHHTGWQHHTPERDSKGWQRIILRGCGGYMTPGNSYSPPEFDCSHGYTWACEDCPIGIVSGEEKQAEFENEHQGPPRPEHMRPEGWRHGLWDAGAVGAEYALPTEPLRLHAGLDEWLGRD